jgi:ABC-type tungstate transport system permease subunit
MSGFDGVKLVSKFCNRCLGVRGESLKPGTDVIEWSEWHPGTVHGKPQGNNWWVQAANGGFRIVNEASGQSLTDPQGKESKALQEP